LSAPQRHVAGDTLNFTTDVSDYLPSDGWTFKMRLIPRFSSPVQAPITLTATTSDSSYLIQAGPNTTSAWAAGQYSWFSWVEKTGERHTLEGTQFSGELTIEPDPSTQVQGYDGRSQAQKAVDDLKTALATFTASNGRVKSYTIGDRSMTYDDRDQILRDLSYWEGQKAIEANDERMAQGLKSARGIYYRLDRV
jgi:hypothetical protein